MRNPFGSVRPKRNSEGKLIRVLFEGELYDWVKPIVDSLRELSHEPSFSEVMQSCLQELTDALDAPVLSILPFLSALLVEIVASVASIGKFVYKQPNAFPIVFTAEFNPEKSEVYEMPVEG